MFINVNFTLNINPNEWEGRASGVPAEVVDINDPDIVDRISKEVRAHAENVIRDLYEDMGWIVDAATTHA
jgi:hypothetical protein